MFARPRHLAPEERNHMPNKMLIDASHPEETRVVVTRGNRIEEFDFESQDKKQLRGNIYLARVTRVEPSLQAAFVEYGGNRHGFLAFSEIHPDYYQIPVADRQALLRAEAEAAENDDDDDSEGEERSERGGNRNRRRRRGRNRPRDEKTASKGDGEANGDNDEDSADDAAAESSPIAESETQESDSLNQESGNDDAASPDGDKPTLAAAIEADVVSETVELDTEESEVRGVIDEVPLRAGDDHEVESVGAEDALDEVRTRRKPMRRHYKIQEVIKRRQILLVQVVKEERGNKGAALTTYLSLAGRYSVLMPNTARGGGISRKITSAQDRKRLKDVMKDLEVPQGMGVILRTAGENRTKAEIKRDYEYLMRLWENVRNLTLASTAPALVYEEGSLIKRSVRDLYNKDIEEILVAGEDGYREAKDFMRMLMPSHAKMVQPYRDTSPIFARNGIEAQLDRMVQPQVTLKSGGYIIINQTEALVSIDVNSGRSTREHSIEDTALQTNLEAADEVARQLRLRDLAGLIVIDFIDMEEHRNNRAVEKKLKDCLKNDRARIQVGRISHFGLLEMSRQRIRASVLESTMKPCPHCGGTGHIRSDSSIALLVVRGIEDFLLKDHRHNIIVKTPAATALYVLNHKRSTLVELETRFGLTITIEADDSVGSQYFTVLKGAAVENPVEIIDVKPAPVEEEPEDIIEVDVEVETAQEDEDGPIEASNGDAGEGQRDRKRRKRRRRRGGKDRDRGVEANSPEPGEIADEDEVVAAENDTVDENADAVAETAADTEPDSEADAKKRRRGKRGGKRHRTEEAGVEQQVVAEIADAATLEDTPALETVAVIENKEVAETAPKKKPARKPRKTAKEKAAIAAAEAAKEDVVEAIEPVAESKDDAAIESVKKVRPTRRKPLSDAPAEAKVVSSNAADEAKAEAAPKKGWWQRKGFF